MQTTSNNLSARPVNGDDYAVWKWTRAPPASAGSCDVEQS